MPAEIFLHALTSSFVIIDPIGSALIFHSLTAGGNRKYDRRMALRTVAISTLIILLFAVFGEVLLTKLGISIAALRVSGDLLQTPPECTAQTHPCSGIKMIVTPA